MNTILLFGNISHTKTSELTRLSWLDLAIQQPESHGNFHDPLLYTRLRCGLIFRIATYQWPSLPHHTFAYLDFPLADSHNYYNATMVQGPREGLNQLLKKNWRGVVVHPEERPWITLAVDG